MGHAKDKENDYDQEVLYSTRGDHLKNTAS